ncbi:hypothetical protein C8D95_11475 [Silicimonas algicola]|uniref:Uncharacterized protein n=1 Tax=Silicimonas algicola TaxID=1826607 RepID=A0A316FXP2_9RHOB|nr:hypothetical protein C8D95_11475 [Silicimonas algicola]
MVFLRGILTDPHRDRVDAAMQEVRPGRRRKFLRQTKHGRALAVRQQPSITPQNQQQCILRPKTLNAAKGRVRVVQASGKAEVDIGRIERPVEFQGGGVRRTLL